MVLKFNAATYFAVGYFALVLLICLDIFVNYPTPSFGRAAFYLTAPWLFVEMYYENHLFFLNDLLGKGYIYLPILIGGLLNAITIHLIGAVVIYLKKQIIGRRKLH
jgi:hypothetical protein